LYLRKEKKYANTVKISIKGDFERGRLWLKSVIVVTTVTQVDSEWQNKIALIISLALLGVFVCSSSYLKPLATTPWDISKNYYFPHGAIIILLLNQYQSQKRLFVVGYLSRQELLNDVVPKV
jgi:hypothetical protein